MTTTKPRSAFRFRPENFTLIPNDVWNLVLEDRLKYSGVLLYAYLLAKAAVAKLAFSKPYTAVSVEKMSAELGLSKTTIKASLRSLVTTGLIERKDTPGHTRTLILVKVSEGKIVRIPPSRTERNTGRKILAPVPAPNDEATELFSITAATLTHEEESALDAAFALREAE